MIDKGGKISPFCRTIRKRLGYKNLQTTLRYAERSDAVADQELRACRRQQRQTGQGGRNIFEFLQRETEALMAKIYRIIPMVKVFNRLVRLMMR